MSTAVKCTGCPLGGSGGAKRGEVPRGFIAVFWYRQRSLTTKKGLVSEKWALR